MLIILKVALFSLPYFYNTKICAYNWKLEPFYLSEQNTQYYVESHILLEFSPRRNVCVHLHKCSNAINLNKDNLFS